MNPGDETDEKIHWQLAENVAQGRPYSLQGTALLTDLSPGISDHPLWPRPRSCCRWSGSVQTPCWSSCDRPVLVVASVWAILVGTVTGAMYLLLPRLDEILSLAEVARVIRF